MRPHRIQGFSLPDFDWDHEPIPFESENEFLVEENWDPEESILDIFLAIGKYSQRIHYERSVLSSICKEKVLAALRQGSNKAPAALGAWLDERSRGGGGPRSGSGSVSAKELYQKLKLKRFGEDDQPDVDTRRIHIPNPDSWTVAALVLTASRTLAPVISNLLWRHFTSHRSFKATFTPGAFAFNLEFHMPYFAWRRHVKPRTDSRKRPDGSPCRKWIDLSFLTGKDTSKVDGSAINFLYEAQTSVVVAGYNNRVWTAILLTDNYFVDDDAEVIFNEDSLHYHEYSSKEDGIYHDALTVAEFDANTPIWDPREYFCTVVRMRLNQLLEEWSSVSSHLKADIEPFVEKPSIPSFKEQVSLASAQTRARAVEKTYEWVNDVALLLIKLIGTLSKAIESWSSFATGDIYHFEKKASNQLRISMHQIYGIFDQLAEILVELKDLQGKSDFIKQQLDRYILVAGNRAVVFQNWNIRILHVVSPLAIAAGIMQSNVVFFQPAFVCLGALYMLVGLMMYFVEPALTSYHNFDQTARRRRQPLFADTEHTTELLEVPWDASPITFPEPTFSNAAIRERRRTTI
ncbi:hypothetical protein CDEST_07071 [Colletotrichum destructivum]|uniref:Uncharacterized protein n=1 Tax=Colletotrichum destructivum TaxID=34406 RepID=A0AAX4IFK2_9PEZI|nr:hypothetical protein CDEST_07071 [Colletotrichum destructivum]